VLGYAWLQAGSEPDSSLSAPAVAGPAVLPVSAIAAARDVATVPTNGSRGGTSTAQGEQPAGAAVTATTAVAASTEDAVPSLEDQELAGYATAGN
jgi:acetylornithine/succinyldiaminopimelate/putrescine aminotransferase